jgi:hypothetical protein
VTDPALRPEPVPSGAGRGARTLALTTAGLALATVVLVLAGLARELLAERDLPVVFAAAAVAVLATAAVVAPTLARTLRQGPEGALGLPPARAGTTVAVAVGATWSAAGFASYPTWSDWFFAVASGVFVSYFLVPIVLRRAALGAAPPAPEDEGKP